MISPKKVRPDYFLAQIYDGEFAVYDVGSILVASRAAESLDLPKMLDYAFGDRGSYVLAAAIVSATSSEPIEDYHGAMSTFYLKEIIEGELPGPRILNNFLGNLDAGIVKCAALVEVPEEKFVFVYRGMLSRYGSINTFGTRSGLTDSTVFIVAGKDGDPAIAGIREGGMDPVKLYETILNRAQDLGGISTFCLNLKHDADGILPNLILKGRRVIARADAYSHHLIDRLADEIIGSTRIEMYAGVEYRVVEHRAGMSRANGKWTIMLEGDIGYDDAPVRMNIEAWYSENQLKHSKGLIDMMVRHKKEELEQMGFDDAVKAVDSSPIASRILTVSSNDEGRVRVIVHRKEKNLMLLNSGVRLFVTNAGGWRECMDALSAELLVSRHSHQMMETIGNSGVRFSHSDAFIAFLAMKIRIRLETMASQSGSGVTVGEIFRTASQYKAVDVNGTLYRSSIPRRTEELFRLFGIDDLLKDHDGIAEHRHPRAGSYRQCTIAYPVEIPKSHPRYKSLMTREHLVEMVAENVVTPTGLISHGRGEAFDYLMGEMTLPPAEDAERAAAAMLVLAENPVVCVNGNAAALDAKGLIAIADAVPARIEVNLFHRTPERMEAVISHLEEEGAKEVLGRVPEVRIPGLDHDRALCTREGIWTSDVILVPIEDGDRAEALVAMGKKVISIDLNPLSRTSRTATVPICDEITRATANILCFAEEYKRDRTEAQRAAGSFDAKAALNGTIDAICASLQKGKEE